MCDENILSEKFCKWLNSFDINLGNNSGLVLLSELESESMIKDCVRTDLEKAKKYKPTAVYFRHFPDNRPSLPQFYLYDYTSNIPNNDEIAELHRKLWNAGQVPLFFVFTKTDVKIYNCLKEPTYDKNTGEITFSGYIELAVFAENELDKIKGFSAKKFDNGTFWESEDYKKEFNLNGSVYETLLQKLKIVRDRIIDSEILPKAVAEKLLVKSILVKYLEERKDEIGNTVFPKGYFNEFAEGEDSFINVIRSRGACLKLFDDLSKHFNGEIFKWEDDRERKLLKETDLTEFANFFEGKTAKYGQVTLWRLYSFTDLPIELISNIYETFLLSEEDISKKGIVYTPPFLVNFLIEESMPLDNPKDNSKILDPACGSGVFLVAAYRRLIQWWRIKNNWKKPDKEDLPELKRLLKDRIYGVDINKEAIQLAMFSLTLALCDELSPKVIWDDLKFDNLLGKNLFDDDFFELIKNKSLPNDFDLIIGNPPFISKNSKSGKWSKPAIELEEKQEKIRSNNICKTTEEALLFLEQSLELCENENSLVCLLVPADALLHKDSLSNFRKYLFQKYNIPQIVDFTVLRRILFPTATVAVTAVFAQKRTPVDKEILHVVVKRTKPVKEKLYFEIDKYDFHYVNRDMAIKEKFIWKCNLFGGGRVHYTISRLDKIKKFKTYIKEKKKINKLTRVQSKNTKNKPYLLIKKNTGDRGLETYLVNNNNIRDDWFKSETIKIYALRDKRELEKIINYFQAHNNLYKFYIHCTSKRSFVGTRSFSTILGDDIYNVPYLENQNIKLYDIEKIIIDDVINYIENFIRLGENSKVLKPIKNGKILKQFGELYCEILNTVYKNFHPSDPIFTESFVCYPFYYGEKPNVDIPDKDRIEEHLNKLLIKEYPEARLRIIRVITIYEENVIYLVKPNQLRYWLRSVAIRDADETAFDLFEQGY